MPNSNENQVDKSALVLLARDFWFLLALYGYVF